MLDYRLFDKVVVYKGTLTNLGAKVVVYIFVFIENIKKVFFKIAPNAPTRVGLALGRWGTPTQRKRQILKLPQRQPNANAVLAFFLQPWFVEADSNSAVISCRFSLRTACLRIRDF